MSEAGEGRQDREDRDQAGQSPESHGLFFSKPFLSYSDLTLQVAAIAILRIYSPESGMRELSNEGRAGF